MASTAPFDVAHIIDIIIIAHIDIKTDYEHYAIIVRQDDVFKHGLEEVP